MTTMQYGLRGPDPRNTIVPVSSYDAALEMRMAGDVVMVSEDGGRTWSETSDE